MLQKHARNQVVDLNGVTLVQSHHRVVADAEVEVLVVRIDDEEGTLIFNLNFLENLLFQNGGK